MAFHHRTSAIPRDALGRRFDSGRGRARDAHEDALHVRDKLIARKDFTARKSLIVRNGREIEPG